MSIDINEICEQSFATHKATLIQDSDRYLIIDWRREDGSVNYYVNYIVDKKRGSLIVSGDLGDSIATWYNHLEPADLKRYIHNDVGYYIGKFQCTSDKYSFDTENILSSIKYHIEDEDVNDYVETSDRFENAEEFWEFVEYEVEDSILTNDAFIPTEDLNDVIEEIYPDSWEWLGSCGRSISIRVYLWAEGFYMACNQLGI